MGDTNGDLFFFGAGFSKSLNQKYPLLNNFFDELIKRNKDKEDLSEKLNQYKKIFNKDIEKCLTYLASKLPYKSEVEYLNDLANFKELTTQISDYLWELESQNSNIEINKNQENFLQIILENKIPCITLNYDLLLENKLLKICNNTYEIDSFYKFPIQRISNALQSGAKGAIFGGSPDILKTKLPEILKLHGSINWYYSGILPTDTIYLYDNKGIITDFLENMNNFKNNLSNFIIPPVLDKQNLYNHIIVSLLWRKAYDYIKNAKRIFIYGYSFPKTDMSTEALFKTALAENKNNCKIIPINTGNETTIARYEEIFGECIEQKLKLTDPETNDKLLAEFLNNERN